MTQSMRPDELVDSTVVDHSGSKIGKVGTVYLADDTHEPEWVTVRTGMFGQRESFVPLHGANLDAEGLHVSVAKDQVSDAPRMDVEGHLSHKESAELYRYYDLPAPRQSMDGPTGTSPGRLGGGRPRDTGRERSEHSGSDGSDGSGGTMMRSEEQLKVGTEQVETGRVRLRKYVVTEEQQVSVPVSHEEVRLEREPITDADRAGGVPIGEDEQEIVLHEERPVVRKESVPVEKVRLGTEQVTEEQTVTDQVRKERIEVDGDDPQGRHRKE
ncbi:DUF2382 domain-containing protein [Prauserella cavernicola]|uniref:PRC and DUF2382 domain-containing protein n=1 Tax=Prauserella cavernicola TaxID=2800127 RepID=A0A934QRJ2_9PSEU|nr:PRC and DUF2382 domain-containing protein [Prauserella cavernicola]MBK1785255.1 PRC and DUF2382 domain-containing protein [Prauserella cavernicola]